MLVVLDRRAESVQTSFLDNKLAVRQQRLHEQIRIA